MKISKEQRASVCAMFAGRCAYCGCELQKSWHVDHLIPVERRLEFRHGIGVVCTGEFNRPENHSESNFMPACSPCNIDKGTWTLKGWRQKLQNTCAVLMRNNPTYRHGLRFGLIAETAAPVTFYFERVAAEARPCP